MRRWYWLVWLHSVQGWQGGKLGEPVLMGRCGRFVGHVAGQVLRLVCKLEGMSSLAMYPVSLLSLVHVWVMLVLLELMPEAMMMRKV